MDNNPCIFCKIIKKDIPAKIVFEDDEVLAFDDIKPQAPVHVIVIPKTHVDRLSSITGSNSNVTAKLMLAANTIAINKKINKTGYRVVINCGRDAGQAVDHLHLHLLGGRAMAWPPG